MAGNGCYLESQRQVDTSKAKPQCDNWKAELYTTLAITGNNVTVNTYYPVGIGLQYEININPY